jgi:hypothetical protein
MKIKKGLLISSFDFWYDLTDGGYLDPLGMCVNIKDAERVNKAIEIILDFQRSCETQIDNFIQ